MTSISTIPGIGPKTLELFSHLKITTIDQLLNHFPSRYLDFSTITTISSTIPNQNVTLSGTITKFQNIYTRNGKNLQKAVLTDPTGQISLIWFNQSYLAKSIIVGQTYTIAGTISLYLNQKTIIAPHLHSRFAGKIVPIYPQTQGLSSNLIHKAIKTALLIPSALTSDPLPSALLVKHKLLTLPKSLEILHQPPDLTLLNQARLRLSLSELLSLQVQSHLYQLLWAKFKPASPLTTNSKIDQKLTKFIKTLPFTLTPSQQKVWAEVRPDLLSSTTVSNRLIQGDVGSGKTVIAILSSLLTALNHQKTIILAPTQILCHQHYLTFSKFLSGQKIKINLLTANSKLSAKTITDSQIIITTQAIFFKKIDHYLSRTALVVIDEQHKFGVKQRSFFQNIANPPHLLTMTATPIPRTISLALLGNLSLSTIEDLPKNRLPIKTFVVPPSKSDSCYRWVEQEIVNKKAQAFIVCPYISPSESNETVASAEAEFEHLKSIFPHLKIALIHGLIKSVQKDKIMADFQAGETQILVTTPIIEVGIDVPNSSIIIIQSAELFGLAQLHQLRGRVGRSSVQSYCYLLSLSDNPKAISRLNFVQNHSSGIDIAQYDLSVRGPGEIFAYLQHGFPSLKLATLSNLQLLTLAQNIITTLKTNYPDYSLSKLLLPSTSSNIASFN